VYNLVGQYVRQYEAFVKQNSFQPIKVMFYIVNSKDLANTLPIVSYNMMLSNPSIKDTVTFTVSSKNIFGAKVPKSRMLRNSCRFKFKGIFCAYLGDQTECDKTLARCKELNNSPRYGGSPTIGNVGVSV